MPSMTSRASLPLFVAAESFSSFGNSAIGIVLPWLVLSRIGDPAVTGLVAAFAADPVPPAALASASVPATTMNADVPVERGRGTDDQPGRLGSGSMSWSGS